jgi:hypothetical protein
MALGVPSSAARNRERRDRIGRARGSPDEGDAMHIVVRTYSGGGASELFDAMEQREEDVRELITGVPGFVSYAAFRTDDGIRTVTACEDKAGTDESSKRAAAWVSENVGASVDPPEIAEGSAFLRF